MTIIFIALNLTIWLFSLTTQSTARDVAFTSELKKQFEKNIMFLSYFYEKDQLVVLPYFTGTQFELNPFGIDRKQRKQIVATVNRKFLNQVLFKEFSPNRLKESLRNILIKHQAYSRCEDLEIDIREENEPLFIFFTRNQPVPEQSYEDLIFQNVDSFKKTCFDSLREGFPLDKALFKEEVKCDFFKLRCRLKRTSTPDFTARSLTFIRVKFELYSDLYEKYSEIILLDLKNNLERNDLDKQNKDWLEGNIQEIERRSNKFSWALHFYTTITIKTTKKSDKNEFLLQESNAKERINKHLSTNLKIAYTNKPSQDSRRRSKAIWKNVNLHSNNSVHFEIFPELFELLNISYGRFGDGCFYSPIRKNSNPREIEKGIQEWLCEQRSQNESFFEDTRSILSQLTQESYLHESAKEPVYRTSHHTGENLQGLVTDYKVQPWFFVTSGGGLGRSEARISGHKKGQQSHMAWETRHEWPPNDGCFLPAFSTQWPPAQQDHQAPTIQVTPIS